MSEADAKVNMSLDDIIKMEKKDKKKKAGGLIGDKAGAKRNRGGKGPRGIGPRGPGNQGPRGPGNQGPVGKTAKLNAPAPMKFRRLQQEQHNRMRPGFVTKRYKKNKRNNNGPIGGGGLMRSRSNVALNRLNNNNAIGMNNARGAFVNSRRGIAGKFGLMRSRSRTNVLSPNMKRFFTNNKGALKRTNSLPNLRDPTSVHNRLGYQSPAQVAYRNRVKRAKQLLIQRQNQRMQQPPIDYRVPHNGKAMVDGISPEFPILVDRRLPIVAPQRNFNTARRSARSDHLVQDIKKRMEMTLYKLAADPNVDDVQFNDVYQPGLRRHAMRMGHNQNRGRVANVQHLARARSPYRPSAQHMAPLARDPMYYRQPRTRARSRSRSRSRNAPIAQLAGTVDDRTFSEMMYSLSGNLGVTERTLNERFSF